MNFVTPYWIRRGTALVTILLMVGMLTACIEAGSNSTIGPDLKGTTTMRVGIAKTAIQLAASLAGSLGTPSPSGSPPAMAMATAPTADDLFGDLNKQITALGGSAKPFDDGSFVGEDILFGFSSLDEMQKQINTVLGDSSGAAGMGMGMGMRMGMSGTPGSGALAQITVKDTGTSIRIDGIVDPLSDLSDPSAAAGLPPGVDFKSLIASGGTIDLSFTMPGAVTSADDLATQDGNTVSWSFKVGDKKATIFAEAAKA